MLKIIMFRVWRPIAVTVEPLYKDTPEMRTSLLIRTPCIVPAT